MLSSELDEHTAQLQHRTALSKEQVSASVNMLTDEYIGGDSKKRFLIALSEKGETQEEFSQFVRVFRGLAKNPELEDLANEAIDLCGTGGDQSGSFNISTAVSFLLAASNTTVIKHGNRSISSKCGSADLIEAVGIPLETDARMRQEGLKRFHFSFLFAPSFHPAFKSIAPVRKALAAEGKITIFNRLGPTLNPAKPAYQLLGVYNPLHLDQISRALSENGGKGGWVVHGKLEDGQGVDELTSCGDNCVSGYGSSATEKNVILSPSAWGQKIYPYDQLSGGALGKNLEILLNLAKGSCPPGLLASILINAATAFKIAGKVANLGEGVELAESVIKDGRLKKWLNDIRDFFKK